MRNSKNALSYTQQLEQKRQSSNLSHEQIDKIFKQAPVTPVVFEWAELTGEITRNQLFRTLVSQIKQWAREVESTRQKVDERDEEIHKFLFKALKAITFEQPESQLLNLQSLEKWYFELKGGSRKTTPVKTHKKRLLINDDYQPQFHNYDAFMRLKGYTRRTFELEPKLLYRRRELKSMGRQDLETKYLTEGIQNRIYERQMKKHRKERQNRDLEEQIQRIGQAKSRNELAILNRQYFADFTLHRQAEKENRTSQTEGITIVDFTRSQIQTAKTSLHKKDAFRVKTAAPYRCNGQTVQNEDWEAVEQEKISESQELKNKLHASKTTIDVQSLYKGTNEPSIQVFQRNINLNGMGLMSNPFVEPKKLKKAKAKKT